ncbi:APC family permease [Demequina sp.]|uniref:APC family permease n=1 Tax=Demequina sp. TaxID=2050685 RepID=UPI0025C0E940|nr:APC family permease [Demequina sp.]
MSTRAAPERRLGLFGAVGVGVGSMLGAGVFVVWGPAATAAGPWLLVAIGLAAGVAIINAMSVSLLAARHPVAGGAYTYGRRELSPTWGFVAGVGFVVGKTASVAAMALAIGSYAWPAHVPVVGTAAIVAAWAVNAMGVTRTARATTAIAVVVLAGLAAVIAASLTAQAELEAAASTGSVSPRSVASAAALVFFAFAGYARLATLGEEVRDPRRTIPRAIAIAIGIVVVVYLALGATLLRRPGVDALAGSSAPLSLAVPDARGAAAGLALLAAVAAMGAMVALMAGIGRTAMAMARESDLPASLARIGRSGAPQRAEAVGALGSITLVWWGDLGFALAMSSVAVLVYYAVANAAAYRATRRGEGGALQAARMVPAIGFVCCVLLALSLDVAPTLATVGSLAVAAAIRAAARRRSA